MSLTSDRASTRQPAARAKFRASASSRFARRSERAGEVWLRNYCRGAAVALVGSCRPRTARVGVATLTRLHPARLPQLRSIAIDWRVLCSRSCAARHHIPGLAPALSGTRVYRDALKHGGRSSFRSAHPAAATCARGHRNGDGAGAARRGESARAKIARLEGSLGVPGSC